jgi:hypothetical protein
MSQGLRTSEEKGSCESGDPTVLAVLPLAVTVARRGAKVEEAQLVLPDHVESKIGWFDIAVYIPAVVDGLQSFDL